jgi:hypothetical protein
MTHNESALDNYEGSLTTGEPRASNDDLFRSIKAYTASVPPSVYLGISAAAITFALAWQLAGKSKWRNVIALWMPTCLAVGLYNKFAKLKAHDPTDSGAHRGYAS